MQTSAKEVLEIIARDLKDKGYTHETAAHKLGYATRQAVSAIMSADKYMTRSQAHRFNEAFGYYEPFLISGEGSLTGPVDDKGTTFYLPQHALLLRPFDDPERFKEAFTVFMDSMIQTYGDYNIQKFLSNTVRYISLLDEDIPESAIKELSRYPTRITATMTREERENYYRSGQYIEERRKLRDRYLTGLYDLYNKMTCEQQNKDI